MIRPATPEDIPAIVAMGEKFHAEAGWADIAEYRPDDCARSIAAMIEGSGIVLVAEREGQVVGMAGGVVGPLYFNAGHVTGQELFLYMTPGLRDGTGARLLAGLEDEARRRGCQSWIMIALDRVSPEATGRLYQRRGYRAAEHSWIRRL